MRDAYMLVRRGYDPASKRYIKRHDVVLVVGDKSILEGVAMLLRAIDKGQWGGWARLEQRGWRLDKQWVVMPFSHTLPGTREGAPENGN